MTRRGRVIGLDLGSRRIGVAVTDSERTLATGVTALARSGDMTRDHASIAALVDEYQATAVVVGMPLSMSGNQGPAARQVAEEVRRLSGVLVVQVTTVDERLTTVAASGALRRAGRAVRHQRPVVDQTAAAMLLQTWIDQQRSLPGDDS